MAKYVFDINKYNQKHTKSLVQEQQTEQNTNLFIESSTINFNYDKLIDTEKIKNTALINMDWDFLYALIGKSYKHLNK